MSKKRAADSSAAPEELARPMDAPRQSNETSELSAPETPTLPPALTNPDTIAAYQALYDQLGRAYWESSDIKYKDTIQGVRDSIYEILTELNRAKLDANTDALLALQIKIKASNKALARIKDKINNITKNISTASSVIAAIGKVVSLASALL